MMLACSIVGWLISLISFNFIITKWMSEYEDKQVDQFFSVQIVLLDLFEILFDFALQSNGLLIDEQSKIVLRIIYQTVQCESHSPLISTKQI